MALSSAGRTFKVDVGTCTFIVTECGVVSSGVVARSICRLEGAVLYL